jgi:S1-C subfamily serine protease
VQSGFLVAEVLQNGPAYSAGLRVGDVIVGAEGEEISQTKDLLFALSQTKSGSSITLEVNRMGSLERLQVVPTEAPPLQRYSGR